MTMTGNTSNQTEPVELMEGPLDGAVCTVPRACTVAFLDECLVRAMGGAGGNLIYARVDRGHFVFLRPPAGSGQKNIDTQDHG